MSDTTKIEWANHTASPWHGCTHSVYTDADGNEHEHPGCANCYAEKMAKRNPGVLGVWGSDGTRVRSASFHGRCVRWNRLAEAAGERRRVFPSICDPFESWDGPILNANREKLWHLYPPSGSYFASSDGHADKRPVTMDDLRRDMFATIDACPWLDFLLLTKRPQNIRRMWLQKYPPGTLGHNCPMKSKWFRPNVWLITSISDQASADALIPPLLECRDLVQVLGVSAEPLLGEIDLRQQIVLRRHGEAPTRLSNALGDWIDPLRGVFTDSPTLDFVIIGCESNGKQVGRLPGGTKDGYWRAARSLIEQCRESVVACFHKQAPVNCRVSHDMSEWPEWARVREFPR